MKFVKLFLLSFLWTSWGSLVVDLPQQNDQKIFLNFSNDLKLTKIISFCIRFLFTGIQEFRSLFCSEEFCLKFDISHNYGFVYLKDENLIFKIPKNSVQPHAWHHFCFSSDGQKYQIITEGNIWYQSNRKVAID